MDASARGCETCGASVAPSLMVFHREWHAAENGQGRRFWKTVRNPSLDQHVRVIAALEAVPKVSARPAFVTKLRAQLVADAAASILSIPLNGAQVRRRSGATSRRLGRRRLDEPVRRR